MYWRYLQRKLKSNGVSMASNKSYLDALKKELDLLIDDLVLTDLQKKFLRSRWLDQVIWIEGKTDENQKWYYRLHLVSIIGGVIIPALVSLNLGSEEISIVIRVMTFILSLIVAISVAIEQFFHYGERWRHYRHNVETLKSEGWQLSQLSGPYRSFSNHSDAFGAFVSRVEEIQQRETELFICDVSKEDGKEIRQKNSGDSVT